MNLCNAQISYDDPARPEKGEADVTNYSLCIFWKNLICHHHHCTAIITRTLQDRWHSVIEYNLRL